MRMRAGWLWQCDAWRELGRSNGNLLGTCTSYGRKQISQSLRQAEREHSALFSPIARGHVGKASDSQMLAMHGAGAEAARWTGRDGWTTAGVMFHLVMQIADV